MSTASAFSSSPSTSAHVCPATVAQRLGRSEVRRFDQPVLLRAESGTLWVTVDGEPEDIVLEPGEARAFDGRARVLATALGSDVVFSARPGRAPARRLRWPGWAAWATPKLRAAG